ncbi:MAG: ferritin family protein [Nitrospirae bacterium]|nr:ferritin family protein [Nitrospirota bacterium]
MTDNKTDTKLDNLSVREVVEMAVRTEILGHGYYTDLSKQFVKQQEVHDLFSFLAGQEEKHIKRFTELKDKIGGEEPDNWQDVSEYMRAYVESAFFMGRDKALPHMHNITEANAALGLAIGFEKETLLYFYAMRDMVKEHGIVDEIIKEEKSHIVSLARMKDKLSRA